MTLLFGDFREVLAPYTWDACIMDAPYGKRTHRGNEDIKSADESERQSIGYAHWTAEDVASAVSFLHPRTRGWFCTITDHELARAWEECLKAAGRYVFTPLPVVVPGMAVRLQGDGPSSWTCWMVVARPRTAEAADWGTLPGAYVRGRGACDDDKRYHAGGKPLSIMRAIVRDYSRRGDVVCDPTAGMATTLIAAEIEGRKALGAERDPETYARAIERMRGPVQPALNFE